MPINFEVAQADLSFEAAFPEAEFALHRENSLLMEQVFKRLQPHGLRLNDVRIERGAGNIADYHLLCFLFNYLMTVKIRVDKVEVICHQVPENLVEKYKAAILDVLRAVKDCRHELSFQSYSLAVGLHGKPQGQTARDYLAQFVAKVPQNLGRLTGNGAVFYFGPDGERLWSSVTADVSVAVQDAVYVRIYGVWDARKVTHDSLWQIAEQFYIQAGQSLGLGLRTYRQ